MTNPKWWAYLHCDHKIILKRWFGDHKDYTEDCDNNPFVLAIVEPFEAHDDIAATKMIGNRP